MFKIATWNVNSLRVRLPQVLDWIGENQPDVLAIQETKLQDENFPVQEIELAGYRVSYVGQKTYNGVAILSKSSLNNITKELPGDVDQQRRILSGTIGKLRIINVYVPNGASLDSDKYQYKLKWLDCLSRYVKQELAKHPYLIILGDFNIAPEDRDVHDPLAWQDCVLVSEPERKAFADLLNLGLCDAFRLHNDKNDQFSWWDYRAGAFYKNRGMRIDHILVSEPLISQCANCIIDKSLRALKRPSDHTLVVVEFEKLLIS